MGVRINARTTAEIRNVDENITNIHKSIKYRQENHPMKEQNEQTQMGFVYTQEQWWRFKIEMKTYRNRRK